MAVNIKSPQCFTLIPHISKQPGMFHSMKSASYEDIFLYSTGVVFAIFLNPATTYGLPPKH